jgi:hypothetical protein
VTELINRLERLLEAARPRFLRRAADPAPVVETLREVGASGLPDAIPRVFGLVAHRDREISEAAALAVELLLRRTHARDLPALERFVGSVSRYAPRRRLMAWVHHVTVAGVERLEVSDACRLAVLGVLSFSPDGYKREAAVRALDGCSAEGALPFLLLRVNDWVPQVREAARHAVGARLVPDQAAGFVACLSLVERLAKAQRVAHGPLVTSIERLVAGTQALAAGFRAVDRRDRRAAVSVAVRRNHALLLEHAERLLSDHDPAVRWLAAHFLCHDASDASFDRFRARLLRDRAARIRYETLDAVARRRPSAARDALEAARFDASGAVRELAWFHLRRDDPHRPLLREYVDALPTLRGPALIAAVASIGELGRSQEAAVLVPFAGAVATGTRKVAIRAIARLDAADHAGLFHEALESEVTGVSRAGADALAAAPELIDQARVGALLQRGRPWHHRRNAFRVLLQTGKWDRIYWALEGTHLRAAHTRLLAWNVVKRWLAGFNRSFAVPTGAQLDRIEAALKRSVGIQLHQAEDLTAAIRSTRRIVLGEDPH